MKHIWKRAVASLLVLVLIVPLCLGCGDEDEEKVVITIGEITDLTGPGAPAVISLHYALEDMIKYYNEEELIPGVKLKLVFYDTKLDPAREVPGYDWVRGRGAQLIISIMHTTGEMLKPFAERDKFAVANLSTTLTQIEPPGWIFCFANPNSWGMLSLLKWISEEHWDWETEGPARIGFGGWREPSGLEVMNAIEAYCQAHPEQFDWAGGFTAPMGTMVMSGEVERLKDCDYVGTFAIITGHFVKEFRTRGYPATFIDAGTLASYRSYMVDVCGWEALDGTLTANCSPLWMEPLPIVDLATQLVHQYRSGQAEDIIAAGLGYVGGCHNIRAIFDVLQAAIEKVGAENFDGQAFYDVATNFSLSGPMWEGYPEWAFTETKRNLVDHYLVYKFDAEAEELVRQSDWLLAMGAVE